MLQRQLSPMVTAEMDSMDETPRPEPGRTRTHRFPRDPRSPRAATPPPSQPSRRPDVRNSPRPGGAAANTLTLDIRPVPPPPSARQQVNSNIMDTALTAGDVAAQTGVSVPTVRRAAVHLGLRDQRTHGGHRRFSPDDARQLTAHLGVTPAVDGFTPSEVKVLAALSRRPTGLRSLRAVARATRLSPTTAGAAIQSLASRDLVTANTETVAEGSARELTVYRLVQSPQWSHIAPVVSRTVPPLFNEALLAPATAVPQRLWHHFWNVEPSQLRLPADEQFVARRLLLSEDPVAWAWAAQHLSAAAIAATRNSRGVDGPTGALIDNLVRSAT